MVTPLATNHRYSVAPGGGPQPWDAPRVRVGSNLHTIPAKTRRRHDVHCKCWEIPFFCFFSFVFPPLPLPAPPLPVPRSLLVDAEGRKLLLLRACLPACLSCSPVSPASSPSASLICFPALWLAMPHASHASRLACTLSSVPPIEWQLRAPHRLAAAACLCCAAGSFCAGLISPPFPPLHLPTPHLAVGCTSKRDSP